MTLKAIITTLDNLPILKTQVDILRDDPVVDDIVVVSNESKDGTNEWLAVNSDLTSVIRENMGAGPGRNAGLDAAGECDYYLLLDGGIRPLIGGARHMFDYMERTPEAGVVGVEIPDFETDYDKAWRRWVNPIKDNQTYVNTRLSHTAYCLARRTAFDGLRFEESGPFGMPGWGADDDEMMCQWRAAGIYVHVVSCACNRNLACTGVHPYRHAAGSHARLFRETGIYPTQYGSVYEQRVVWLQQNWPQYAQGTQWNEPWITVVVKAGGLSDTIKIIKEAHSLLAARKFDSPWEKFWNPYSIVLWMPKYDPIMSAWAETVRLRHHYGDTIIYKEKIVRRSKSTESLWTGEFRVFTDSDWELCVRSNSGYYALVETMDQLHDAMNLYSMVWPRQASEIAPPVFCTKLEV